MEAIADKINFVAILIAVVANFFLGFIWYTPLFGKTWAKELGFDTSKGGPTTAQMVKGLSFSIIGNFLLAWVFAHNIAAWTFVPGSESMTPLANILSAAIFTWLGFYVPIDLNAVAWEGRSWKLFAINSGYHLMMLLVAATIIVLMK